MTELNKCSSILQGVISHNFNKILISKYMSYYNALLLINNIYSQTVFNNQTAYYNANDDQCISDMEAANILFNLPPIQNNIVNLSDLKVSIKELDYYLVH